MRSPDPWRCFNALKLKEVKSMLAAAARHSLVQLVRRRVAVAEDARLCKGLLNDALRNEHRKEVNVLVHAIEAQVVSDLQHFNRSVPLVAVIARLVQKLRDEKGTGEMEARWAVETWALALGVIAEHELTGQEEG